MSKVKVTIIGWCNDTGFWCQGYKRSNCLLICNYRFFSIVIWFLPLSEYDINPPEIHVQDLSTLRNPRKKRFLDPSRNVSPFSSFRILLLGVNEVPGSNGRLADTVSIPVDRRVETQNPSTLESQSPCVMQSHNTSMAES